MKVVFCVTLSLLAVLACRAGLAADAPSEDLIQTITNLLSEKDKDLRALGLQQVREEAKGEAATKRFAALLPKLAPEGQAGLLDALGGRGDRAARPAVLDMLKSPEAAVRAAALRALGPLGETADVPVLLGLSAAGTEAEKAAALSSLAVVQGEGVHAPILAELKRAKPLVCVALINVLVTRRAKDAVPALLEAAQGTDAAVRTAAMTALAQLAGPEQVPAMLPGLLKAEKGPEREAAERAIGTVAARNEDAAKRADLLLAAMDKHGAEDKIAALPALGRVGGPKAQKVVEAALASTTAGERDAALRALCNWPDASVADKLLELAEKGTSAAERTTALRGLARAAVTRDQRTDALRLDLLKKCMSLATRDEERKLVLDRAKTVRTLDALHFILPCLDKPALAQQACLSVVEMAHHRVFREPNKAEFDKVLDRVIRTSKDPVVIDRAERYKRGQTWYPPAKPAGAGSVP